MSSKQTKWRQSNPEKAIVTRERERACRYTEAYRRKIKNKCLKARYGITVEDYEHMLQIQKGVCAICNLPERARQNSSPTKELKPLVVDHSHKTGQVRELLCHSCNAYLGLIEAKPDLVQKLFEYLKKHNG